MQRRVALLVGSVHVRSALEMFLDGLKIAHLGSGENIPCSSQLLGRLAALATQQFRNLGAFLRQRIIERCLVFPILGVHRRLGVEQRLGQVEVAVVVGNIVQRRLAAFACSSDVGLGLEQRRSGSRLAELGCEMQCRITALVFGVHIRAAGQKFLDRLHVAHLGGGENILGGSQFLRRLAALAAEQFDNLGAFL